MLASAIILFRESLEAALIVTIVLSATRGVHRRGAWISLGILAGLIGSYVVALFAQQISSLAEGAGQEYFNATILLAACLMLGWHNIWMARHASELSSRVRQAGMAVFEGQRHMSTLSLVVGLAVLREGSEVVLFVGGILAGGAESASLMSGALAGLTAGILFGALIYVGLMRIPLRYFFTATAWLILVLAAGLASQAAGYLVQAGVLPPLVEPLWDSSAILSERNLPGQLLSSLAGYTSRPSGMQLVFWLGTFALIWIMMHLTAKRTEKQRFSGAKSLVLLCGLVLLYSTTAAASHYIYSPIVDYGETEVEFRGHYNFDDDENEDGSGKYKLDIGRGIKPRWFTEVVFEYEVPGQGGGELTAIEWENIFQLTEQGEYAADWGILLEYSYSLEDQHADKIEFGPLMQMEFGRFVWTNNLIFEKEIGQFSEDEVEWEFATRLKRRVSPAFEPAIEIYGSRDELQIGPALLGRTRIGDGPNAFAWEAGILAGLTHDTPDVTVRFLIEAEFY